MEKEYLKNKSSGTHLTELWKTVLLVSALFMSSQSNAQNTDSAEYYKLPIQASVGNQTVGFPYQNLVSAFNPSVSAGTEFAYNKNPKHRICQTVNVNFFTNDVIGNTVSLRTDFCYRYTHKSGVFGDVSLGFGILNQNHPGDTYAYNSANGEYDKVRDFGKVSGLIGNGLSLGYDFSRKTKCPISLYVRNSFYIQTQYFDLIAFPIMPQSITEIGLRIKIKRNEK